MYASSGALEWYRYRLGQTAQTLIGFSSSLVKCCDFRRMNIRPDLFGDDFSSAIGTETFLAHDLVPEGLPASSKGHAEQQM